MWKLKESVEGATRAQNAPKLKDKLEGCCDLAPGTPQIEVGLAMPGLETTFGVVLASDFTDQAALDTYQVHPAHHEVKKFVAAVPESCQCVDHLVDDAK